MSEIEHVTGKIKNTGVSFNDFMIMYRKENERPTYHHNDKEWFDDVFCDVKCVINGIVYDIEMKVVDQYDDISILAKDGDNFDFEFKYYNGGTCFSEMLEDELQRIGEK